MIIKFQYLALTYCFVICTLPFVFNINDLKHYDGNNGKLCIDKQDFNLYSCLHLGLATIGNTVLLAFGFIFSSVIA